jgi:predicted nucleic acid-binding protein
VVSQFGNRLHLGVFRGTDRWIAATALRLGIPLVSNDTIFKAVPDLTLESLA